MRGKGAAGPEASEDEADGKKKKKTRCVLSYGLNLSSL